MTDQDFAGAIVIMAANPWDGVRMADRQLAERLTRHAPVLYVEPAVSIVGRLRRRQLSAAGQPLRKRAAGLFTFTPSALPGLARRGIAPINSRIIARQVRRVLSDLGGSARAVIDADILLPIMRRCGEQVSLYWAQDDFVGLAPIFGLNPSRLAAAEARMAAAADVIVAANPVVADSLVVAGYRPALIPYGCDFELFRTATTVTRAPDVSLAGPMAVFMGHLGERIDAEILRQVVERGTPVLLVGPVHARAADGWLADILAEPNVQWVGERDFRQLPEYLAHAVVGLLPYNHSRFNVGSFPLKTLEYLAAGLPVVATDLPAIGWLQTEHIKVHDAPEAFADEVAKLVAQGRDSTGDRERQEFAQAHTWEARAASFAALLRH